MKKVNYNNYLKEATESLPKGAFLTVKAGGELNTMTIGWGTTGVIWGKPVIMVMVRKSRHTYQLIENTEEFTVSFDFDGNFKEELRFCGSKSGRDYDKFDECSLKTIPGDKVETPVIDGCNLHYECKIKFKEEMNSKMLSQDFNNKFYAQGDYHTLYFGEIINCYLDR